MFQGLIPVLRTWNFEATLEFYQSVLGFECVSRNDEYRWAQLRRDKAEIMFSGPNEHLGETEPIFTGSLYFQCNDVEDLWQAISSLARVCYPLEDFEYGMREFAIFDNNGYLLQFGKSLQLDD
jgi:uncharacterized glyoxalase superfamily protein PhnB